MAEALPLSIEGKIHRTETCWLWIGARSSGYGRVRYNGKTRIAYRLVYELLVGPIPENLELDHLCRNRSCVNPDHLDPVTRLENQRRSPISRATIHGSKEFCPNGHRYTPENTRIYRGSRYCRTCNLRSWRRITKERTANQ